MMDYPHIELRLLTQARETLDRMAAYDLGMTDRLALGQTQIRISEFLVIAETFYTEERVRDLKRKVYEYIPDLDFSDFAESGLRNVLDMIEEREYIPGAGWEYLDLENIHDRTIAVRSWLLNTAGTRFRACPHCGGDLTTYEMVVDGETPNGVDFDGVCLSPECPMHNVHPYMHGIVLLGEELYRAPRYSIVRTLPGTRCLITDEYVGEQQGLISETWFWEKPFFYDVLLYTRHGNTRFKDIVRVSPAYLVRAEESE